MVHGAKKILGTVLVMVWQLYLISIQQSLLVCRKKVKKLQADLASGKVHAFTGPIMPKGNLMVAAGKTADDGMLAGMMTYVKGVEGDIPK